MPRPSKDFGTGVRAGAAGDAPGDMALGGAEAPGEAPAMAAADALAAGAAEELVSLRSAGAQAETVARRRLVSVAAVRRDMGPSRRLGGGASPERSECRAREWRGGPGIIMPGGRRRRTGYRKSPGPPLKRERPFAEIARGAGEG